MAKWYRKNREKKINYQKKRQPRDTSRKRARRKLGSPKGKDVHHIDGNPFNNSKSNLQVVKRHHGNKPGKRKQRS